MDGGTGRLVRAALRVWTAIGGLLLLTAFWWVFREPLSLIAPPLAIAAVLIYLLDPGVSYLQKQGVARPLGTLLSYLASAVLLWLALSQLGPLLADQVRGLLDELPGIGQSLESTVNRQLEAFGVPPASRLELQPEALTEELRAFLTTNEDQVLGLIRGAGSVVSWIAHIGLAIVLGPILAFYALADLPRLGAGARRLLPPDRRPEVVEVVARIGRIVGAYFRGQLLVALFVGTATAVGLAIIGLPFWAVVGATTGVFNLVPLVGPTAGAVFGVLLALTVGGGVRQAVLVVVVMVIVQQIDNHLVTPVVVARSVAIHPITVILALVVAGSMGGIAMMFFVIPLVAVLKLIILHVVVTRVPSMGHVADEGQDEDVGRPRRGNVATLARELRRSFERRIAEVAAAQRARSGDTESVRRRSAEPPSSDDQRAGESAGRSDRSTRQRARDVAPADAHDATSQSEPAVPDEVSPSAEVAPPR